MENNSQAIELKGIARSLTKLGVQDGQCEDIVNLRLKDGSWRVSDDGKHVYSLPDDYTQLYVHTNVYHHLLGVLNGKLWYFANIENDGETFTPLESPVEICDVQGDVTIVQNGHLLTIICAVDTDTTPLPLKGDEKEIKYSIFITGTNKYQEIKVDPNGKQTDRELYPFGRVNFNIECEFDESRNFVHEDKEAGYIKIDNSDINYNDSGALVPKEDEDTTYQAAQIWHASMLKVFNDAKEVNVFTRPLLATIAIKLYDNTYVYASNPVLLFPREKYSTYKTVNINGNDKEATSLYFQTNGCRVDTDNTITLDMGGILPNTTFYEIKKATYQYSSLGVQETSYIPFYTNGAYSYRRRTTTEDLVAEESYDPSFGGRTHLRSDLRGYQIVLTLGNLNNLLSNSDVFKGLSIFVTQEVDIYNMSAEGYKKGVVHCESENVKLTDGQSAGIHAFTMTGNVMYKPEIRNNEEIIYDLINSPFFLLREYSLEELVSMSNKSTVVDLSSPEYKGLLSSITTQPKLSNESVDRRGFTPEVAYSYNQRLHIANYKAEQFCGYPIDFFQFSNHNVKIEEGSFAAGGVLPNLKDGDSFQYPRNTRYFATPSMSHMPQEQLDEYVAKGLEQGTCFAAIEVTIDSQQGEQKVCRYIKPYDSTSIENGMANFVESLSPLLTFPDARATNMKVKMVRVYENSVDVYENDFKLKPHIYLNIAYYLEPNLKPIDLTFKKSIRFDAFVGGNADDDFKPYAEVNNTESYPNGLKVSKVNNPFYFPNATTYQVGSAEIVALMSNAVAVGAGQTGAAPLYVFCKDGIYALLVDSSGELAYTNARIIARDVCNNAKSVTPIDSGVVFTTDRGLMEIAGNEVVELGQIVEGDVFDIVNRTYIDVDGILKEDKAKKIMFNSFTKYQLGALPQGLLDNADFLTFLRGAIVNYNHNERELMISNPNYPYTYVMDRYGNWSRRDYKATEYVNNYPTSYRVDEGKLYKVDTDDGVSTNNGMYLLSQVIKLGTIAFKQAYRLVVRGYFETPGVAYGNINGVDVEITGVHVDKLKNGTTLKMCYKPQYGQNLWVDTETGDVLSVKIVNAETKEDVTNTIAIPDASVRYSVAKDSNPIGCYVFGSYDGRKWGLLGRNEKGGKFTDIGCNIAHSDVKFLRLCISGQLSKDSRIDFVEIAAEGSVLNAKIR